MEMPYPGNQQNRFLPAITVVSSSVSRVFPPASASPHMLILDEIGGIPAALDGYRIRLYSFNQMPEYIRAESIEALYDLSSVRNLNDTCLLSDG